MHETPPKRKIMQQKEAFHNAVLSVPFFLSPAPTTIVAVNREHPPIPGAPFQDKSYYNGNKFVKTRIFSFSLFQEAVAFYQQYSKEVVKFSEGREWVQYCRDLSKYSGVLFHQGKVFVPWLQSKQMRELIGQTSQMVVCHGLFMEQHIKRTNNPLFRFIDHKSLSLEHIFYRWRVYAYLQSDGEKRYRSESFSIVDGGMQWFPPLPSTIQRGILNHKQRKHFSQLVGKLSRRKHEIEEAMVFAISRLDCAVEIVAIIGIQIFERITEDFIPHFYLISDILFNTTTPDYRRLFARVIPISVYRIGKELKSQKEVKLKSELRALFQLWEMKFIFDENYTKGLLFLLSGGENGKSSANGLHERLKAIGRIEDDEEGQYQLQKLCFSNGIPMLEHDREESTRLINDYLWLYAKAQERPPQINQNYDGQAITEKDLLKIKNKQVKVVTSEGLSINMLLQRNWQTKSKVGLSSSVDHQ